MILFGVLTICASCLWLVPLARHVLRPLRQLPYFEMLSLTVGVGLSLAGLSWLMMWLGLLPGSWLSFGSVATMVWAGLAAGVWWHRHDLPSAGALRAWVARGITLEMWLAVLASGAVVVISINLISYPFYTYDVLSRYAVNARQLFALGYVPATLTGYPLAVQMLYALGFMAAGAVNDHTAGIYSAALVVGALGAVWLTARMLFSGRAAWAALILTLSASVFVNWATSGYIDIPNGYYHGLTFMLACLWLWRGDARYAVLAGVFAGLSLWVKQSSLVLIPALGIVPLLRLQLPLAWQAVKREARPGAMALGAMAIVGAPWYVRSYLLVGAGGVVPTPSTYDELFVNRTAAAFLDFWARRADWGWPFALSVLCGLLLWLATFARPAVAQWSEQPRRAALLLAAFVVPYHIIWWWQFTYQSRYLLTSLPMYAALAGLAVDWAAARLPLTGRLPKVAAAVISLAIVGMAIYPRLGAVYYLAIDPLQSDDTKLTRRAADQWLVAKYVLHNVPAGAKIFAVDGALAYWLYEYDLTIGYAASPDDLRGYDYYITAPWSDEVLAALGRSAAELNTALTDPSLFLPLYGLGENSQVLYEVKFR